MKPILFFAIVSMLIMACKQTESVSSNPSQSAMEKWKANAAFMSSADYEYQKFPPHVQFKKEEGNGDGNGYIQKQNRFIASSGLPTVSNMLEWTKTKTVAQTKALYLSFKANHFDHSYISVFKQYQGWLHLTRLGILSNTDEESLAFTRLLTQDLIATQYKGYGLLYYALKHLKDHQALTRENIGFYRNAIISYASTPTSAGKEMDNDVVGEIEEQRGKPLPDEFREALASYAAKAGDEKSVSLKLIGEL